MNDFVALICARGGSKGLPRKNVKSFLGKPLLCHSIDLAKDITRVSRIIVSTDDEEIAELAKQNGAEVPFTRPPELSHDEASEWLVWEHAVDWLYAQTGSAPNLVVLPPTAPLRNVFDVNGAIDLFISSLCDGVVCGTESNRNPEFNMVAVNEINQCRLALDVHGKHVRRQDAPEYFDLTTVCYVMSPQYIKSNKHLLDGDIRLFKVPACRSIDIDNQFDFDIAEFVGLKLSG